MSLIASIYTYNTWIFQGLLMLSLTDIFSNNDKYDKKDKL